MFIDIDAASDLAMTYGVSSVPQLNLYRDGLLKEKYLGSDEAEITTKIGQLMEH